MAIHMVKVTFTIDPTTAASLQELATEWGVPKSEAVRRAVRQAKEQHLLQANMQAPIDILEHLERHPILSMTERKDRLVSARQLRKGWNLRGTN
jgi:transposase-like protein